MASEVSVHGHLLGSVAFEPLVRQSHHGRKFMGEQSCFMAYEQGSRESREGAKVLQPLSDDDLTPSLWVPPPNKPTTSQQHHKQELSPPGHEY